MSAFCFARSSVPAAILGLLLTLSGIGSSKAATVTTNGFDFYVHGTRTVIKGMNYSPVPIGAQPGDPPYGDYFVPNYVSHSTDLARSQKVFSEIAT